LSGSARVLEMVDQPLIVEVIKLTLNHGVYVTREAQDASEATAVLGEWRPDPAVIDMDIGGSRVLEHLAGEGAGSPLRTPVLALTRRGDLRTKLAAFEQGVDDVMTIPFSPVELLARVLVTTRRALGESVQFNPVQRLGDLEIDILQRLVRAGTARVEDGQMELRPGPLRRAPRCPAHQPVRAAALRPVPPDPSPASAHSGRRWPSAPQASPHRSTSLSWAQQYCEEIADYGAMASPNAAYGFVNAGPVTSR
jgi:DNA-binding response OmpR family regulator